MGYDEDLAARVRGVLSDRDDVLERKMFGGLAFMVCGSMCCGIVGEELMVRVGPARYEAALAKPHARPMNFTGRPLKGMVYVGKAGLRTQRDLGRWVGEGVAFVEEVPVSRRSPQRPSAAASRAPKKAPAEKPAPKAAAAKAAKKPRATRRRA